MADVPLMSNPMTTAEDIIVGGASGAPTRLPVGDEDDVLTVSGGAVAWVPGGGGGGGGIVGYDVDRYNSGNITVTATTATALSGPADLVVPASAGDVLEVTLLTASDSGGNSLRFDVATMVSGSAVNFFSSLSGTAGSLGVVGWFCYASINSPVSGAIRYVVQSGDISGGNVTLRLYAWVSGGSRVVRAISSEPIIYSVVNLGQ